jgi:nucleoid DNA-binding protein
MRTINKKNLAKAVAEAAEISLAEADQQVDSVLSAIAEALQAGEEVRLTGFGTFGVRGGSRFPDRLAARISLVQGSVTPPI